MYMNKYNHVMLPSPAVQKVKTIYEMIFHLSNQTMKNGEANAADISCDARNGRRKGKRQYV